MKTLEKNLIQICAHLLLVLPWVRHQRDIRDGQLVDAHIWVHDGQERDGQVRDKLEHDVHNRDVVERMVPKEKFDLSDNFTLKLVFVEKKMYLSCVDIASD